MALNFERSCRYETPEDQDSSWAERMFDGTRHALTRSEHSILGFISVKVLSLLPSSFVFCKEKSDPTYQNVCMFGLTLFYFFSSLPKGKGVPSLRFCFAKTCREIMNKGPFQRRPLQAASVHISLSLKSSLASLSTFTGQFNWTHHSKCVCYTCQVNCQIGLVGHCALSPIMLLKMSCTSCFLDFLSPARSINQEAMVSNFSSKKNFPIFEARCSLEKHI